MKIFLNTTFYLLPSPISEESIVHWQISVSFTDHTGMSSTLPPILCARIVSFSAWQERPPFWVFRRPVDKRCGSYNDTFRKRTSESISWESVAPTGIGWRKLSCGAVYRRGSISPPSSRKTSDGLKPAFVSQKCWNVSGKRGQIGCECALLLCIKFLKCSIATEQINCPNNFLVCKSSDEIPLNNGF